jgi:hypothetical protein
VRRSRHDFPLSIGPSKNCCTESPVARSQAFRKISAPSSAHVFNNFTQSSAFRRHSSLSGRHYARTEEITPMTARQHRHEVGQAPSPAQDAPVLQLPTSISEQKLTANRANAQLSTGAITGAGKAIVSQNATKHGLTGKFKVLPSESQSEFDEMLAAFLRSESPVGDDEIEMVHQMAEALWLSRRCVRLQNDCFAALESGTVERTADLGRCARLQLEQQLAAHKSLLLYIRYQTTQDRTFSRYLTELRKRRNERARAERGFVSQKHKEAADRRREETHRARQALQTAKQEGQEIRNRLAAARAEALELKNLARKTQLAPQKPEPTAAAAGDVGSHFNS